MSKPKVSIVISCYNDKDIISAVSHAHVQQYPEKEIIVVDDGSTADIKDLIKNLSAKIDLLITQENSGQSIARNNAIKEATGKYILNWDSDDYFEPSFCSKAVAKLEEEKTIKIVTCHTRRFTKNRTIDTYIPQGGELKNFLFSNAAIGSSMFRREDWEKCGGYEETLPILGFEDWEFFIRILQDGGRAFVIPEVLFHYQVRKNSTTQRIKSIKHDKFRHIVLKHSDLYQKDFNGLIDHFFCRIKQEELQKIKTIQSLDYRIGKLTLKPIRTLKGLLKGNAK